MGISDDAKLLAALIVLRDVALGVNEHLTSEVLRYRCHEASLTLASLRRDLTKAFGG